MAHVILATRGINQSVEVWKTFMQSQMWGWCRWEVKKDEKGEYLKNPDGSYQISEKPELTMVQGALRPIQLWEYVFPRKGIKIVDGKVVEKDNLPEVFAMMNERNPDVTRSDIAAPLWALRKLLGAQKIPAMPELREKELYQITDKYVPSNGHGVATYAIGLRDDKMIFMPQGDKMYFQEGL